MNLSALTLWFIPFGNILIPLGLWMYRKNRIQGAQELGKRILNFQITWTVLTYGLVFLSMRPALAEDYFWIPFTMLPVVQALLLGNTVFVILTHRKISRGEGNVYPYSLKLLS